LFLIRCFCFSCCSTAKLKKEKIQL
jgi:hypothetical protein